MDDQADLELHLCATSALKSRCPLCQETAHPDVFPFCSKRCAMLDLGRWMRGEYSLEDRASDESDESSEREWAEVTPDSHAD